MLRFDVETIYKATQSNIATRVFKLRFDVETIYKATLKPAFSRRARLRFDVETIYKATTYCLPTHQHGCGLM